jgi:hypothetical protein
MIRAGARLALAALALTVAGGCLSFEWSRHSRQSPPPAGALESLQVGSTTLKDALDLLGAPLDAYEHRETGIALAYGWHQSDAKGARASVPVYDRASASMDYTSRKQGLKGLLLFFDEDLRLTAIREGWLEDLTSGYERQPPAVLDDEPTAHAPEPPR